MVKYKYIGQKSYQVGKTLWEILGNLENMGVGRLITRGTHLRYKEPCFFKIVKVIPVSNPEQLTYNNQRKVIVWSEVVFRGRRLPNLRQIYSITYKPDYQLIPKTEEDALYKRVVECKNQEKIIDPLTPVPPLLKMIINMEKNKNGESVHEEPKMKLLLNNCDNNNYRFASDGETPTHSINYNSWSRVTPSLFENIDECRDIFVAKDAWKKREYILKWEN